MGKNTLARHRFGRDPEEGGGGGTDQPGGEGGDGGKGGKFTPPSSQEELDRIISERLSRERSKYADYDVLKAKAAQWDTLEAESMTDFEKDLREAREDAFNEAMSQTVPNVVRQAFRAEAKGTLSDEQVASLLEDLDLIKYAKDDGGPDEEKIAKKVAAFAPSKGGGGSNGRERGPGFGQGSGHDRSTRRPGEGGLAEAARRFPEQFAQKS